MHFEGAPTNALAVFGLAKDPAFGRVDLDHRRDVSYAVLTLRQPLGRGRTPPEPDVDAVAPAPLGRPQATPSLARNGSRSQQRWICPTARAALGTTKRFIAHPTGQLASTRPRSNR